MEEYRRRTRHNSLILDRFVHRCSRDAEDEEDVTASMTSRTCTNRPIRASLRVADAPAVSRLYLHWPSSQEYPRLPEPYVIAAHRHSILFKARVPLENQLACNDSFFFPLDFFVYSAFTSPPSLHRLPVCLTGGMSAPEDEYFVPYRNTQQRPMYEAVMGILCHGDKGEFTVADLTEFTFPEAELCLLHHRGPGSSSSAETEWRVRKVKFPVSRPLPPEVYSWTTDAVVAVHNRFLCWIDYYQGILIVDILLANNSTSDLFFRYIPLPEEALQACRLYPEGDCHDPSRCVSINVAGILKFVCITNDVTRQVYSASHFTVTSWTLSDFYRGKWIKDGTLKSTEFWDLYCGKIHPRMRPSYPLGSFGDPDIIFFLLKEDKGIFWMIEVNIKEKVLNSSALYINEEEEEKTKEENEGGTTKIAPKKNRFDGHSFIISQFSTYLSKDAIRTKVISICFPYLNHMFIVQGSSLYVVLKYKLICLPSHFCE